MVIINSFQYPESPIRHEQRNVRVVLDKEDLGLGTLFISESTLGWRATDNRGFTVGYQDVSLHAISKDENLYPKECLYVMLDGRLSLGHEPQNEEDSDSDEETEASELILVPSDENATSIPSMYEAIKICQALNPDAGCMDDDDDDDDDNLYADAEDELEEEDGHHIIHERAGDAEIDSISRRLEQNSVDVNYALNGNDDHEFQDAD